MPSKITPGDVFRPIDRGYCLVTYRPDRLCAEALAAIDVTITVTAPALPGGDRRTPNATLRERGAPERPFIIGARRTPHVRHQRKYARAPLPRDRWFDFRGPDGAIIATAPDVATFSRLLQSADASVDRVPPRAWRLLALDHRRAAGSPARSDRRRDRARRPHAAGGRRPSRSRTAARRDRRTVPRCGGLTVSRPRSDPPPARLEPLPCRRPS